LSILIAPSVFSNVDLPVSLDCPFLIAPSVFSNVYLPVSLDWTQHNMCWTSLCANKHKHCKQDICWYWLHHSLNFLFIFNTFICLFILFTEASGGICEKFKPFTEGEQQVNKSLNTGIVTLINYGDDVAPRVSQLTLKDK
jgi:hypothetical protein